MIEKEYDSPKPRKRRASIQERLSHLPSTISGLLMIGAGIVVSQLEMDATLKASIVGPLILAGFAALGMKGKK